MERIPCTNSEYCPVRQRGQRCRTDVHHVYYPKSLYETTVERQFRDLDENKVELCVAEHRELHATQEPPVKPCRDEMLIAIARAVMVGEEV